MRSKKIQSIRSRQQRRRAEDAAIALSRILRNRQKYPIKHMQDNNPNRFSAHTNHNKNKGVRFAPLSLYGNRRALHGRLETTQSQYPPMPSENLCPMTTTMQAVKQINDYACTLASNRSSTNAPGCSDRDT